MQNLYNLFKLDQLYVHASLELNVIETNLFFLQKEGSIRSKTNEKGGQLDRKLIQNGKHLCKILKTCLN